MCALRAAEVATDASHCRMTRSGVGAADRHLEDGEGPKTDGSYKETPRICVWARAARAGETAELCVLVERADSHPPIERLPLWSCSLASP